MGVQKGSGIGRETATAFAAAGAAHIALLGRTEASLKETAAALPSSVSTSSHVVDVTSEESLAKAAGVIGTWDVLVLGAGHVSTPSSIAASNFAEFWQSFEVSFMYTRAAVPPRGGETEPFMSHHLLKPVLILLTNHRPMPKAPMLRFTHSYPLPMLPTPRSLR